MNGIQAGTKVLVTGASGFIGTHLCQALSEQNIHVCALLRRNNTQNVFKHEKCVVDLSAREKVFSWACVMNTVISHLPYLLINQ